MLVFSKIHKEKTGMHNYLLDIEAQKGNVRTIDIIPLLNLKESSDSTIRVILNRYQTVTLTNFGGFWRRRRGGMFSFREKQS